MVYNAYFNVIFFIKIHYYQITVEVQLYSNAIEKPVGFLSTGVVEKVENFSSLVVVGRTKRRSVT